jgi:SAM-dependent methyltransferase
MSLSTPESSTVIKSPALYYADKLDSLRDLFGTPDVQLDTHQLTVAGHAYPIIDDVIILLDPAQYPAGLTARFHRAGQDSATNRCVDGSETIQRTFGAEWQAFPKILPEHEREFRQYFDLMNLEDLRAARVCDLGCGIGRWSYFLAKRCRELVLVDFSDAIFVGRHNLRGSPRTLFFMGDLRRLPFRERFAGFLFCLGVLHTLPTDALAELRRLRRYAATLLVYLYYAVDNRPWYFRPLLGCVTRMRRVLSKIQHREFRAGFTWVLAWLIYRPCIKLGRFLRPFGWARYVPLAEVYDGKGMERIRQDIYDRFFTGIEQRYSRAQIAELRDTFHEVLISDQLPYWHFLCRG